LELSAQAVQFAALLGQLQGAGLDTGKLEGSYRKLGSALDSLKGKQAVLGRIAAAQEKLAQRRAALKAQAVDMFALGAALIAPVRSAMRFEESMADVKKVVDFDEPDGLIELGAVLNSMPRKERIPLKPEELAAIAAAGGQLGVAAQSLPGFTLTVAKMATAFDMLPDAAGETAAKVANVWGVPIERIGALGDAINHLSDNTAAKAPQMLEVLQRVGGTAKIFGLSATQAAALGNAFIALGKTPEVASTGINAMLNRLMTADKQGKEFKSSLKQLGWTAKSLKQAIGEDAQGGLNKFLESLARLDESKRMGILTGLFGMEFADDVSVLVGSLDQYGKAQGLVAKESQYAGSMQREFESRASTTTAQLRILGGTILELGNVLGSVLLPPLSAVAGIMITMLGPVAEFAREHQTLTTVVVGLAAGLATARLAAFGLGYVWTFVQGGALGLAKAVTLLGGRFSLLAVAQRAWAIGSTVVTGACAAMGTAIRVMGLTSMWTAGKTMVLAAAQKAWAIGSALVVGACKAMGIAFRVLGLAVAANPIGLVMTGLALAAGLVIANWDTVKSWLGSVWNWIVEKAGWVGEKAKKYLGWLFDSDEGPQIGASLETGSASPEMPQLGQGLDNLPVGLPVDVAQPSPDAIPISPAVMSASAGNVTINYQPTIQITGASDPSAVRGQVEQALAMDQRELRRMIQEELNRARNEERRLSFG
ncbi:MAG: phage tail tape measure protein, partial [Desulfocurvibacter africanus]